MSDNLATALEMAHAGLGPLYERALIAAMRKDGEADPLAFGTHESRVRHTFRLANAKAERWAFVSATEWRGQVAL